jgi:hypothetical protein
MVLLNDEIVKKLHLLKNKKNTSNNILNLSFSSCSMNYILGGILGATLLLCYFLINQPKDEKKEDKRS